MNHTYSVLFWINRAKAKKTAQVPICARVTVCGKRAEIATGGYIESERWNVKEGNIKEQLYQVFAIP
jgi:hypothetical protein